MMLTGYILAAMGAVTAQAATSPQANPYPLPVHNITRTPEGYRFENLAMRPDGQILVTTTKPAGYIYQVDPLGVLPTTLIYEVPIMNGSAAAINEGSRDVYYIVAGEFDVSNISVTHPDTYQIIELDMRDVRVLPNGTLNREPISKRVANLTGAQLPNGAAFTRPGSGQLLVADSFRGLIWNVDVRCGEVTVALNDTSTKGLPGTGAQVTGINGLKEHNGTIYWTVSGTAGIWKVAIDECGHVPENVRPTMIASNVTCDDLIVDDTGNGFVAGPEGIITKISLDGTKETVAGIYGSLNSPLVGPTAVRFGRMASDQWSLYITTNGGLPNVLGKSVLSEAGVSRIDLAFAA